MIDSARIFIKSGKGGDGHVSFRRELFVAAGGPDGGDGGRGGDVIFEVDKGLNTLNDFRHVRKYIAQSGEDGKKRRSHGADGQDLIVKVPEGTIIRDDASGKIIADMSGKNMREVILKGGRGGAGNMHFATPTMQVPKFAKPGQPAMELWVRLELKVIADVGLVGYPNVGKSTILSMVTNAKPKIANYHFTTLEPALGVVKTKSGDTFVMADIPGIIEDASEGVGLGFKFLKHIERTRLLLHVIDITGSEGRIPVEDFKLINNELKKYSQKLASKKQIVVANKMDSLSDEGYLKDLEMLCKKEGLKLFKISAATKIGLDDLLNYVSEELKKIPKEDIVEVIKEEEDELVDQEWHVEKKNDTYYVTGAPIERLMSKVNIFDVESRQYMQRVLNKMGVMDKARELGLQDGEYLDIIGYQMEYND